MATPRNPTQWKTAHQDANVRVHSLPQVGHAETASGAPSETSSADEDEPFGFPPSLNQQTAAVDQQWQQHRAEMVAATKRSDCKPMHRLWQRVHGRQAHQPQQGLRAPDVPDWG